jgi:hypothetical protein
MRGNMKGILYFLSGVVATLLVLVLLSGQPIGTKAYAAGKKTYQCFRSNGFPNEVVEFMTKMNAEGYEYVGSVREILIFAK